MGNWDEAYGVLMLELSPEPAALEQKIYRDVLSKKAAGFIAICKLFRFFFRRRFLFTVDQWSSKDNNNGCRVDGAQFSANC